MHSRPPATGAIAVILFGGSHAKSIGIAAPIDRLVASMRFPVPVLHPTAADDCPLTSSEMDSVSDWLWPISRDRRTPTFLGSTATCLVEGAAARMNAIDGAAPRRAGTPGNRDLRPASQTLHPQASGC